MVVDGAKERRQHWVFVAHVVNEATNDEWVEVRGGRVGETKGRSFRPDVIYPRFCEEGALGLVGMSLARRRNCRSLDAGLVDRVDLARDEDPHARRDPPRDSSPRNTCARPTRSPGIRRGRYRAGPGPTTRSSRPNWRRPSSSRGISDCIIDSQMTLPRSRSGPAATGKISDVPEVGGEADDESPRATRSSSRRS